MEAEHHPPTDPSAAPIPVLVNSRAGLGARREADEVAAAFRTAGVAAEIRAVDPAELTAEVRRTLGASPRTLGVCGGDGTLLTAAQELAGSETALAVIPGGTLNHFAHWLGIENLEAGAEVVRAGTARDVTVGVLDDRIFLNTAVLGFYADAVRRRNRLRPRLRKWPAAAVGIASVIMRLPTMTIELVTDGRTVRRETPLVWVGVGAGSFPRPHAAPRQDPEPVLEVVVLRTRRRRDLLRLVARMPLHLLRREFPGDDPAVEVFQTRRLLVRGTKQIGVTMDGEVFRLQPPLFLAAQARALRVMVPPETEAPEG